MEPTPPRKPKPPSRPFYDLPDHVETSAKIISEARSSLRTVKTKRPFTPRQDERTLFTKSSSRAPENRPPSAFSLGSRHFDGSESRPLSGTSRPPSGTARPVSGTRLMPLDHSPKASIDLETATPKPPADPNRPIRRKSSKTRLQQNSISLDGGTEPQGNGVHSKTKSGSLSDVSCIDNTESSPLLDARRVHSGPKERTHHLLEDRGVGDGKESIPRPPSSHMKSPGSSDIKGKDQCDSGYATRQSSGSSNSKSRQGSGSSSRGSSGTRTGSSGSKRDQETPEESLYYNQHIHPIIEQMQALTKDKDDDLVVQLTNNLYGVLEKGDLLGRTCKRRSTVLKTIFKFLDSGEPKTLLTLGRLILALKVTGNNLNSVCKLLFRVGKEERNDAMFMENNILDLIIETVEVTPPFSSCDALVYCVGTLKFLSGNTTISKQLTAKGCVEAMALLLKTINTEICKGEKASQPLSNVLVQVTQTLRNLADISSNRGKFTSLSIIEELAKAMEYFMQDFDLAYNIARIFSKLTLHSNSCTVLSNQPNIYRNFLILLNKHIDKPDLVVRTCFVLGNITAKMVEARRGLYQETKAVDTIQAVFKTYLELNIQLLQNTQSNEEDQSRLRESEDVLIKLIRVVANLSIDEDIGQQLATNQTLVFWLMQIIDVKDITTSEELVLNTIATVNNLSYYPVKSSAITQKQTVLTEYLLKLLLTDHMEGIVEASRVFGNLTRNKPVRDLLAKNKVNEIMVALLDSGSREVVYTVCGVLINLMADDDKRGILKAEGGITKLVEVLRDFGRNDWQLASMVCQILWNYSVKLTSSNACFGDQETSDLIDILVEYLDEEAALEASLIEGMDEEMKDYMRDMWECEFCPVASQLLNKIEVHQSQFEQLEPPTT